jgi:hypothetical protein
MKRSVVWAVLAAAWAGSVSSAHAQVQIPLDDPDRPAFKFGALELRPRLVVSNVGVDNNVFNEHENPKSDFTFTASPDLELDFNPGRVKLSYQTGSDFVYFSTYDTERSVNRRFATRAEIDLTVLRPFVSYSSTHSSARAGAEIDSRARHHPREITGGTRVSIASRTTLMLTARRTSDEYDPDEEFRGFNLARALNTTTTAYEGALGVELTPLTSLTLGGVHEQTRFELAPERDSDSIRVGPTLTFSPLGLLTGTAGIGYRRLEGRTNAVQDYSGVVASGSLSVILGGRFKVETAFNRDVKYSYERDVPTYVVTGGRGTLTTQVVGGLDVRVSGGRELMDFRAGGGEASPGKDTMNIYGGGVGYRLANRAQLVLTAEWTDRQSTRDVTREFGNRRIFATLNWGVLSR